MIICRIIFLFYFNGMYYFAVIERFLLCRQTSTLFFPKEMPKILNAV